LFTDSQIYLFIAMQVHETVSDHDIIPESTEHGDAPTTSCNEARKTSRSWPSKVSVSSRGKNQTSRSRGIAGRSWYRSRLGPKTECLGLISVW